MEQIDQMESSIRKSDQLAHLSGFGLLAGDSGLDFVEPITTVTNNYVELDKRIETLESLCHSTDLDEAVKNNLNDELDTLMVKLNIEAYANAKKNYKANIDTYKNAYQALLEVSDTAANPDGFVKYLLDVDRCLLDPKSSLPGDIDATTKYNLKSQADFITARDTLKAAAQAVIASKDDVAKRYATAIAQGNRIDGDIKEQLGLMRIKTYMINLKRLSMVSISPTMVLWTDTPTCA